MDIMKLIKTMEKFKNERILLDDYEIDITLEYEPWPLWRNWKVYMIVYIRPLIPVYSKAWRFLRYKSALRKFNEIVNELKRLERR